MLSQYTTKVKVRVGLGILTLVVARVVVPFMSFPADMLQHLALACFVVGLALCIWGAISHAKNKGYAPPNWLRSVLVIPVAVGVYAAILIFVVAAKPFLFHLAEIYFAHKLHPLAYDYPFIVVGLVVISIAGSYCSVLAGATTAPKRRFVTAIVLAICHLCGSAGLLSGVCFYYTGLLDVDPYIWTSALVWVFIPWTGGFIAVVVACAQVRRRESRIRTLQQEMSNNSLEPTRA